MALSSQAPPSSAPPREKSVLDSFLSLFTEVRPGEAPTALLLMLNVFLLLGAYYIIKPVRKALILAEPNGAQAEAYLGAVIALIFVFLVPAYAKLSNRISRSRLIAAVTGSFIGLFVLTWALDKAGVPRLGYPFFVLVGIFSVMVVAQFWAFANDVYKTESGKRLFPIVALGANLGGLAGDPVTNLLRARLQTFDLVLVGCAILVACIVLTHVTAQREFGRGVPAPEDAASTSGGLFEGFDLLFRHRYVGYIALLVLLLNLVNTTGEYILSSLLEQTAKAQVGLQAGLDEAAKTEAVRKFTGGFISNFYWWANLLAVVLQMFLTSRLVRWGGVRLALLLLPAIAFGTYGLVALVPVLAYVRIGKMAENATDYSVNKAALQMLFLPTSREIKYKAKQATDSFMQRAGDVISALVIFFGTQVLGFSARGFALTNLFIIVGWFVLVMALSRELGHLEAGERPEVTGRAA